MPTRPTSVPRTRPLATPLLLAIGLLCGTTAMGQDDAADTSSEAPAPTITVDPEVTLPGANTAARDSLAKPELVPVASDGSLYEAVDGAFSKAVQAIYGVLFYSVGKREERRVEYRREEEYIRTAGTEDAVRPLNQSDPDLPDRLNVAEAAKLQLEGRLVGGRPTEPLLGRINGEPVDYLLLSVPYEDGPNGPVASGSTYVKDGELWRRRTVVRGLLDEDDTLTDGEVEALSAIWTPAADGGHVQTSEVGGVPLIVLWLLLGAIFFTVRMRLVNLWAFAHAVQIVRGKYDDPNEEGEVTHAQALASALSATVGLGNIAGVTVAMTLGGPGAFFWMLLCGFFGMASKFVECTLAQKYRNVDTGDGSVLGGPMRYLSEGIAHKLPGGFGRLFGGTLAAVFAVMCVMASFGGGIMFQANQSAAAVVKVVQQGSIDRLIEIESEIAAAAAEENGPRYTELRDERRELETGVTRLQIGIRVGFGLVMAAFVGLVIMGGIKRIGATAAALVPTMCAIYLLACGWIILQNLPEVPRVAASIFTEAFNGRALGGGFVGVLTVAVVGLRRAAFSNEAGIGSAAIAHSAAKTHEPIREGCVAMLGPFLDTIVVCSMTALVILVTGAWDNTEWTIERGLEGSALTSEAFRSEIEWFPLVLAVATVLFAFSSIISWSYYGEKASQYLFGRWAIPVYKIAAVICVFVGAIVGLGSIIDFSDMMLLSMAVPNILGCVLLSGEVRRDLMDYWRRFRAGEFDEVAEESVSRDVLVNDTAT